MSGQKRPHLYGKASSAAHQINCLPCRRRKSKCDREEPCSSCVLRQTEAYCYTNDELPAKVPSASSSKRTMEDFSSHPKPPKSTRTTQVTKLPPTNGTSLCIMDSIENIESSVAAVKQFISTSKMANTPNLSSSTSTDIEWDDLLAILPPLDELQLVIDCFFKELTWIVGCVHPERFDAMWSEAQSTKGPIPRHRASMLCTMISFVDLMGPRSHAAVQLPRKPSLDQRIQRENARLLLDTYYNLHDAAENEEGGEMNALLLSQDEALLQLEAEALYCSSSLVAGLFRRGWQALGRAIRLAKSLAVFEPSKKHVEEAEEEQRCRIAWEVVILDRWCSIFYTNTFELGLHFKPPQIYSENYKALYYRNTFTDILARIIVFLQSSQSMTMSQRVICAETIEQECEQWQATLPVEYRYEVACLTMNSGDPDSYRQAAKALNFHTAQQLALLKLFQPFFMDPNAPNHLQFACLNHARKTIECMNVIATLSNSPWVAHSPAWNAQHLFSAATLFAKVFLTDQEEKMNKTWPAEDLDWFASAIFEVVDTFHLVAQGTQHHTARVCQNLLVALCNSKETLKERFQEREKRRLRASTPTIFLDSSRNSQPDFKLDPALQEVPHSAMNNHKSKLDNQQSINSYSQPSSIVMEDFALFDPWEWARLTANLNT